MSGMGGGSTGGSDGFPEELDCSKVLRTTNIISPDQVVLRSIQKGDEGRLRLGDTPAEPILVVFPKGKILGSVSPPGVAKLKDCLRKGFAFTARVTELNGARVTVTIRPA